MQEHKNLHKHEAHHPEHDVQMHHHQMNNGDKMQEMANHKEHKSHGGHAHHEGMIDDFKRRFYISLIVTIPIIILTPMLQHWVGLGDVLRFSGDLYILFALSSFVYFYGGYPFLKGFTDEIKTGKPGMMTLIAVAITIAFVYSSVVVFGLKGDIFFWETATLIDIMLLGHWIEMKSIMGASRALENLAKILPSEAHLKSDDGNVRDVPIEQLQIGNKILIKPGEKIPADGEVVDGETSINESVLTGESKPASKSKGDSVIGGSINVEGSITVEVKRTGKDSFLSQVIELVKSAQESKSRTQDLANRAALWLTIIAFVCGGLTLAAWLILEDMGLAFALERTVTVMVITCPHALGLAVPLVVAVSTSLAAKRGLLIRDRLAFENARKINAVIFDKTGTLTEGKFGVTEIVPLDVMKNEDILSYAASIESLSEHPIAQAIANSDTVKKEVKSFKAIPGKGAEGIIDGKKVMVVSPGYLREKKMNYENVNINKLFEQGKTVVFLLIENELKGAIALSDIIRNESKEAVKQLKEMGIKCMMLTGDNKQVAQYVSEEIGLDEFFAEVLPDKKSEKVKEVQSRGYTVAMVGDGVNDAPALAQADVGIAIGAGTDVAVETADIVLVKNNPQDVVSTIELAKVTYKKMVQNLFWATGYNAFAIPLAAGVLFSLGILLSPALGAVLMSLSTVIVAVNARMMKVKSSRVENF
ncbi:MAG: cadmium-translocating P-type ATPase [Ignavibacteriae bacterium]|nr:MAG: cadmium-translocating P-type ATPase [Ignavibacteriota bacterium]